jgi:lysyl-tRNA synthetase class 2
MSWQPTAAIQTLQLRAHILAQIRAYFSVRSVLEVDTPALSIAAATDPAIASYTTQRRALGPTCLYLHTSPEFAMKRLLAAGSGDIYQICRVFRDDELGRWHQPEFTMLEWYRIGWDEFALMDEIESLLVAILSVRRRLGPTQRMTYRDAFERTLATTPDAPAAQLEAALAARGIAVPPDLGHRGLADLALSFGVVPELPRDGLTFIYDYPADQAALARLKPQTPAVAARFEVFLDGIELANGFAELTDASEQRGRFEAECTDRRRAGVAATPIDERFLAALEHGLPECAGVALGLDRLVAIAAGLTGLDAAVSFAHAAVERT